MAQVLPKVNGTFDTKLGELGGDWRLEIGKGPGQPNGSRTCLPGSSLQHPSSRPGPELQGGPGYRKLKPVVESPLSNSLAAGRLHNAKSKLAHQPETLFDANQIKLVACVQMSSYTLRRRGSSHSTMYVGFFLAASFRDWPITHARESAKRTRS